MSARPPLRAASLLAIVALAFVAASGQGATTPVDLAAISGVSTPESEALDKEADKLVEDSLKAKTDAAAAFKAAKAKIDPKKVAEALKRGDKSVLSQQSPEEQHARELSTQAEQLAKQAYAKADDAATKRAHAALEQRCLAPATASNTPAASSATDPLASPYLCPAVQGGGSTKGENDPWELCSCNRRYLSGLQKDYESSLGRAQGLVGQKGYVGVGANTGIITADMIDATFKHQYPALDFAHLIETTASGFEQDARGIQKDIARGRIRKALGGNGFVPSDFDTFLLSRNGAYLSLASAGGLWRLYLSEATWRLNILQFANEARLKDLSDQWGALDEATLAKHPEYRTNDDASGFIGEMRPLGLQNDQRDYAYIEESAKTLRVLASDLRDNFHRVEHDTKDWANYAAKDGKQPGGEQAIRVPQPINFEIISTRADPVHCCLRVITRNGQLYDDPETHVWAHFPQGLLQTYPEITLSRGGSGAPSVAIHYAFDGEGRKVVGVASGAGDAQRP